MSDATLQSFTLAYTKDSVPEIRPGYVVVVTQKIKEGNREREQKFQGTVIKVNASSDLNKAITVRKISEGIGVEKIFPLHAPSVVSVKVLKANRVRRAKLNYIRNLSGKKLRFKEVALVEREHAFEKPKTVESVPVAEETVVGVPVETAGKPAEASVPVSETTETPAPAEVEKSTTEEVKATDDTDKKAK